MSAANEMGGQSLAARPNFDLDWNGSGAQAILWEHYKKESTVKAKLLE